MDHQLYQTGDRDAPECIMDGNGEVVLALCRRCKRAEVELVPGEPCPGGLPPHCEVCQDIPEGCTPEVCPAHPSVDWNPPEAPSPPPPDQYEEDMQEARSIRYSSTVKLVLLSSGRWGVFYQDKLEIFRSLDEPAIRNIALEDQEAYAAGRAMVRRVVAEACRLVGSTNKTLKDLGL